MKIKDNITEILTQEIAEWDFFKKTAKYINLYFSPRREIPIKIKKNIMYARTIDRILALCLWKFSALENFETELIKRIVKKDMIVFDIGANIGYYTLIIADLVGNNGKVYAFEPDFENYRLLMKNIKVNNKSNIFAIKKAVSNKNGKINLFLSEGHSGNHKIYDSGEKRKKIEIESIMLDNFIKENKVQPDIIKMDIEGSELLALQGMENLTKNNKNLIIIMEFFPLALKKCGYNPLALIEKLKDNYFEINLIDEKQRKIRLFEELDLTNLLKSKGYVNLLLKKISVGLSILSE